jgi:hypothetical protein
MTTTSLDLLLYFGRGLGRAALNRQVAQRVKTASQRFAAGKSSVGHMFTTHRPTVIFAADHLNLAQAATTTPTTNGDAAFGPLLHRFEHALLRFAAKTAAAASLGNFIVHSHFLFSTVDVSLYLLCRSGQAAVFTAAQTVT